jgi:hypothetical protein
VGVLCGCGWRLPVSVGPADCPICALLAERHQADACDCVQPVAVRSYAGQALCGRCGRLAG